MKLFPRLPWAGLGFVFRVLVLTLVFFSLFFVFRTNLRLVSFSLVLVKGSARVLSFSSTAAHCSPANSTVVGISVRIE